MGSDLDAEQRRKLGYKLIHRLDDYYASLPIAGPASSHGANRGRRAQRPAAGRRRRRGRRPRRDVRELIIDGFHAALGNYLGLQNPTPTYVGVLADAPSRRSTRSSPALCTPTSPPASNAQTLRWIGERVGWRAPSTAPSPAAAAKRTSPHWRSRWPTTFPTRRRRRRLAPARARLYCTAEAHHSIDKADRAPGPGPQGAAPHSGHRRDPARRRPARSPDSRGQGRRARALLRGRHRRHHELRAHRRHRGHRRRLRAPRPVAARRRRVRGGRDLLRPPSPPAARIERADSVSMDPHKWLAMPMSAGVVMTSHPEALMQAFAVDTPPFMPTLQGPERVDNFDVSTQWSRRMNSLKLWLTLRVHGRQAYEELIDRQIGSPRAWRTGSSARRLRAGRAAGAAEHHLPGQPAGRVGRRDQRREQGRRRRGDPRRQAWISASTVDGRAVIRMLVISYLTEAPHRRPAGGAERRAGAPPAGRPGAHVTRATGSA